jgi:hypothetical protein
MVNAGISWRKSSSWICPPYNPTPMPMFMVFVPLTIPDDRIA